MKNKTIYIKNILKTIIVSLLFISCSDNFNDLTEDALVGSWDLTGITSETDGQTHSVPAEEIENDPLSYTFFDDYTGLQNYQGRSINFSWSLNNSQLFLNYSSQSMIYQAKVNSKNLKLTFTESQFTITHTFKKE